MTDIFVVMVKNIHGIFLCRAFHSMHDAEDYIRENQDDTAVPSDYNNYYIQDCELN